MISPTYSKKPTKKMIKYSEAFRWGSVNDLFSVPVRLKCIHRHILSEITHQFKTLNKTDKNDTILNTSNS